MDKTTQQLSRWIAVAYGGVFAWSMIDLVLTGNLKYYLADSKFELLVLAGGIILALITLLKVRALLVPAAAHGHQHDHEHDHGDGHSHDDPDHSHDVSLWRLIVLTVPLMILLMGLAPRGFSAEAIEHRMGKSQKEAIAKVNVAGLAEGRIADGKILVANTKELEDAAKSATGREFWESNATPVRAKVAGQFIPDPRFHDRYRLMHIKITCCAADAQPVGITVLGPIDPNWKYGQWLELVGPVSFFAVGGQEGQKPEHYALLHAQSAVPTAPRDFIQ